MGHRANLVLVDDAGYELFYCHWCATTIPQSLFWGPDIAQAWVTQQQLCPDKDCWLDETWAEGGAVIDRAKKQVFFYGGGYDDEDIRYDIPRRRLFLNLMRQVWRGWNIQWAYSQFRDIAQYVGYPIEDVQTSETSSVFSGEITLTEPEELAGFGVIISIRLDDHSLRLCAIDSNGDALLRYDERLVAAMRDQVHRTEMDLDRPGQLFPKGGLHIDVPTKKLSLWTTEDIKPMNALPHYWPGWEIDWLKDNFEAHLALTDNRLRFPAVSDEQMLSRFETILMGQDHGALPGFLSMLEKLKQEGKTIAANPSALYENLFELEIERRRQIFDHAVETWKQTRRTKN